MCFTFCRLMNKEIVLKHNTGAIYKSILLAPICPVEHIAFKLVSILYIVYKVHPNLKAVCSTGHIGANRILLSNFDSTLFCCSL